jgi:hypothetical protein
MEIDNKKIRWDMNKSLSYNAFFNFIVGSRGVGKTYACKRYAIKHFLKTGKQFVYMRRYKTELTNDDLQKFFSDIELEFPDNKFSCKSKTFFIDKKEIGYALPLSTVLVKKGIPFPNVDFVIFDEFIIEEGVYHYLRNEVHSFLEAFETIARTRNDMRVYFLSNALTISNPYFTEFNLKLPYQNSISCKNDILLEYIYNPHYNEFKKQTRFGKIIDGTSYGNYAIDNQFLLDNDKFVEKKTGNCSYLYTLGFKNLLYGVWMNISLGKIFISKDVDKDNKRVYAVTVDDHTPNTLLISSITKSKYFKSLLDGFKEGYVYFEDIPIKNSMLDMFGNYLHK